MNFISRINAFIIFAFYSSIKVMSIKGDIIYASSTPLTIGIPALLGSYLKIPLVFEVRDLWPLIPIKLKIIKKILY